jgi:hypothetical protein
MKWSFVIQQKLKAGILLGGVMLAIILGILLSRRNIDGINKAVSSIYQDRLIPATSIIYLTENLYSKRLSLEKLVLSEDKSRVVQVGILLERHNGEIDSLIKAFEKTYLTRREAQVLGDFKNKMEVYGRLEKKILSVQLSGDPQSGKILFEEAGALTFQKALGDLNELAKIQSVIGGELIRKSENDYAGFTLMSFLQLSLAIIVGLFILIMINNARIVNQPKVSGESVSKFNLN